MGWIKHTQDANMPDWLKSDLSSHCSCGYEKENFYNADGVCTNRRCPNKQCSNTLAQKIAAMCDILDVKGIAGGIGLRLVNEKKLKSHFEAVPFIFAEKPTITLYQLLRITFIKGVDTRWEAASADYSSVDELVENYKGPLKETVVQNLQEIKYGESFFNIYEVKKKEFEPLVKGTVMLSGHIKGLEDRDSFIRGINLYSKGLIKLSIAQNKRKTGVMCLIQEKDEPNRGKAECAIENGIPIMTPDEFKDYILGILKRRLEENK